MRSLYFGPSTDFGSNACAAETFGAAAMRVGAGFGLGFASCAGLVSSTGFTSTIGAGFATATGAGFARATGWGFGAAAEAGAAATWACMVDCGAGAVTASGF